MNETTDIRNKEITIKVKADQDCQDAIDGYMKRHGFKKQVWTDGKDLKHFYYYSEEYPQVLMGCRNFSFIDEKVSYAGKVTFSLH